MTDSPKPSSSRRKGGNRTPFRDRPHSSPLQSSRTPDYLLVGHITADLLDNGSVTLGGTALYSGLAAANMGANVAILTRGRFGGEIAGMQVPGLEEYADRIQVIVQDADVPTTFTNHYIGSRRTQQIKHWAGQIDMRGLPPHWRNAKIVHLGPVADEINPRGITGLTTGFLGVTPQGWMRQWPKDRGGAVHLFPLRLPVDLVNRLDCAIVSDEEIFNARELIEAVGERRMSVVTRGPAGATIYHSLGKGAEMQPGFKRYRTVEVPGIDIKAKSLTGAGDVFAAAFFMKAAEKSSSALDAGEYANVVAALSLRELGAGVVPTAKEVNAVLEQIREKQGR